MFAFELLLRSFILPGLTSILLLLAARRFAFGQPSYGALAALACAIGFTAGYAAVNGLPQLPVPAAEGYLPWIALLAALLPLTLQRAGAQLTRWSLLLLCAAAAFLPLSGRIKPEYIRHGFMDWPQGLAVAAMLTLLILGGWLWLEQASRKLRPATAAAILAFAAFDAALAQYLAHSGKLTEFELALLAVELALALILRRTADLQPAAPALLLLWLLHCALLICGYCYSSLGLLTALILGALPALGAMLAGRFTSFRNSPPDKHPCTRI